MAEAKIRKGTKFVVPEGSDCGAKEGTTVSFFRADSGTKRVILEVPGPDNRSRLISVPATAFKKWKRPTTKKGS